MISFDEVAELLTLGDCVLDGVRLFDSDGLTDDEALGFDVDDSDGCIDTIGVLD